MCGIAGLFTKTDALRSQLGTQLSAMLEQLSFRGPDSAGVAFYREPAPAGLVQGLAALAGRRSAVDGGRR